MASPGTWPQVEPDDRARRRLGEGVGVRADDARDHGVAAGGGVIRAEDERLPVRRHLDGAANESFTRQFVVPDAGQRRPGPVSYTHLDVYKRQTLKYFFAVGGLFLLQIATGILSAHYGVEGGALYGIEIDQVLPYAVVRTWHTQLGILWIATAWLATGLYVAPAVGGREPKFQRLGVNVLFVALVVVVLGSMIGEWLSITGKMGHGTCLLYTSRCV